MSTTYSSVTKEAGRAFFTKDIKGPVVMLNLLRFKEFADYSDALHLAPDEQISGHHAYQLYLKEVRPLLSAAGGEVIFMGKADPFLIGPSHEKWDLALLVRHANTQKFLAFAKDESYLKIAGHRSAALADSRLLPILEHDAQEDTE